MPSKAQEINGLKLMFDENIFESSNQSFPQCKRKVILKHFDYLFQYLSVIGITIFRLFVRMTNSYLQNYIYDALIN